MRGALEKLCWRAYVEAWSSGVLEVRCRNVEKRYGALEI